MSAKSSDVSTGAQAVTATRPTQANVANGICSIVTHLTIGASVEKVWNGLLCYEDIAHKSPLLLRLLLPRPMPAGSQDRAMAGETTLRYEDGHYTKRVTEREPPNRYEFEVIDQSLSADRGVTLLSGNFQLRTLATDQTDLAMTTRYTSRIAPRWLAEPVEAMLCRRLHRHVLDAVRAKVLAQ